MITDQELYARLAAFRLEEKYDYRSLARLLNVSTSTIFSWKNGGKISLKKQRAIMEITAKADPVKKEEKVTCPFLSIILDRWQDLSTAERAEISGKVASMAGHKKDSTFTEEA